MLKYKSIYGDEYDIYFEITNYHSTGGTAIVMYCMGDYGYEPFANLTVAIPLFTPKDRSCVCVDVNNLHGAEEWISENNLGTPFGMTVSSGWCEYPVYALNMQEIKKHLLPKEYRV